MGSELTKDELIKSILKQLTVLPEITEDKLKLLPMNNLWEIQRRITWLLNRPED